MSPSITVLLILVFVTLDSELMMLVWYSLFLLSFVPFFLQTRDDLNLHLPLLNAETLRQLV